MALDIITKKLKTKARPSPVSEVPIIAIINLYPETLHDKAIGSMR